MLRHLLYTILLFAITAGLDAQDFPSQTIVCRDGAFTLVSPLTDGQTYAYQWERSFDGGSSWSAIGGDSAELGINSPNSGIRYRLAYAADASCLADVTCRQHTSPTQLVINIPMFSQGLTRCTGDTAFVGTTALTTAGNHRTVLSTDSGCDSIVETFLQLLPAYNELFLVDLCPGQLFQGLTITADTVIQRQFSAASGCDSLATYEINLAFGEAPAIVGPDRVCLGETATFSAPGAYSGYTWSTGTNGENTEAIASGIYQLTITAFTGCQLELSHELVVTNLNIDDVDLTEPACPGAASGRLVISASGDEDLLYSLDGGNSFQLDPDFTELPAGDYSLVVENADGCRTEEVVSLTDAPELNLITSLPEEVTIERGDSVALDILADFAVETYHWSPRNWSTCNDCPVPIVTPLVDTEFMVVATAAGGCSVSQTFMIRVNDSRRRFVPTAFSPNEDDRNDRWRIFTGPRAEAISGLQIADRWGGIRFQQTEAELPPDEAGWDGNDNNGTQLTTGVYLYTAIIRFADGSTETIGGEINLFR
jgi:gliding motility-associated-like protein